MNFSWMFGSTMEQRHLLAAYVVVWVIQGGYFAWIGLQWLRTEKSRS